MFVSTNRWLRGFEGATARSLAVAGAWRAGDGKSAPKARESGPIAKHDAAPDHAAPAREDAPDDAVSARLSGRGSLATFDRVGVRFGPTNVLEDVSFSISEGEALCIVGPSGGGKSTILNLLAGLTAPTSGVVRYRERPIEGPDPERALVFQDAALFPWLTLERNIAFPLELAGVPKDERRARTDELLRLVHLHRFRHAYPHELSGGMRQRGAIARALSTRPSTLLFDEPFAALDGHMRELLQNEVERILGLARTTMVFVTHQIDEAVRLGDRVLVVGARPGRILGDVRVDVPRPRVLGDARLSRVAKDIAELVRGEVDKVAREEADDAWGTSNGLDRDDSARDLAGRR